MGLFDSTFGRAALGTATLGGSEIARAGNNAYQDAGGLSNILGVKNNSQYGAAYDMDYLQQQANQQGQIYGGQMNLAQALQQQMAGQGPNPAQTQLMGNTQANIANTQGMIASQRGLNPALAARMGANAGAQANQQAALGSALLQQQQQLGATQNLGNLYGQMQQGNLGYQGLANQSMQNAQGLNAKVSEGNTGRNAQLIGGAMNAIGGSASKAATGGAMSQGGKVDGQAQVAGDSPKNDKVHVMLSPGEIVVPRSMAHDPERAKAFIDSLLGEEKKKKGGNYGEVLQARRKAKK